MPRTRPLTRALTRPLTRALTGEAFGAAFDPLDLNPYLYFDTVGGSMLDSGGSAASFLDKVATLDQLATGGNAGSDATQSTDSLRPVALTETGLYLPGVSGNYASVPDEAALDIIGDIELVIGLVAPPTIGTSQFITKDGISGSQRSFNFNITAGGLLKLFWTVNGTGGGADVSSTAAIDSASTWFKVTLDVDNGASGNDVTFYESTDGETWDQVGAAVTTPGVTSIFSSTTAVGIGASAVGSFPLAAVVARAIIKNGIDGTTVLDIDFTDPAVAHGATSFTATTGQTVTINQSGTNDAVLVRSPFARNDFVDDVMTGTAPSDIASDICVSCYRDRSTNTRGVRQSTVTAATIITNSGTNWTLATDDNDLEAICVIPAGTDSADITALKEYFATRFSASII